MSVKSDLLVVAVAVDFAELHKGSAGSYDYLSAFRVTVALEVISVVAVAVAAASAVAELVVVAAAVVFVDSIERYTAAPIQVYD